MEPRPQEPKKNPQDRKEQEKKRPSFKPELERLEERITPSSLLHDLGIHPAHSKPW